MPKVKLPIRTVSDRNTRYRLTDVRSERIDGKDLAVRNTGMACGTTGAPVCPSKGTKLVATRLDD
jgi:hypothetical protein